MLSPAELRRRAEAIRWYHTIDLGQGVVTRGVNDTPRCLPRIALPADLSGKSVLDIGAWDGAYAFEAERRGAARVLATDHYCWSGEGWGTKAGFDLVHEVRGSRVESRDIDVFSLARDTVGLFDIVLFLGVLYHLQDPLGALRRLAAITGELLILETVVDLTFVRRPAIALYPGSELSNDPTNWCGPNAAAVAAMLKCVGFRSVEVVWPRRLPDRVRCAGQAVVRRLFRGQPPTHRMAFHARR
jgi:tRNA (mo5U34)-methyltransferase